FPPPGDAELLCVIAIDLRQRRIARGGVGAGISRPFALRQRLGGFRHRAGDGLGVERGGRWRQGKRKADHRDESSPSSFAQGCLPVPQASIDENKDAVKGDREKSWPDY